MAKILLIVPYAFYPPKYGGALRCFYILRELAREHEVSLLTVQPLSDFEKEEVPTFPENVKIYSIASGRLYRSWFNIFPARVANAINSRLLNRSIRKRGDLYLLNAFPALKKLLLENSFDLVCYENLECYNVLHKHVKRLSPQSKQVYDAHNIDSELWLQHYKLEKRPQLKNYAASALSVEKNLHSHISLCLTCSEIDKFKMKSLNECKLRVIAIPNGVDTTERPFDESLTKFTIPNILFCGTLDYSPNTEGLLWFYHQILPIIRKSLPQLVLTVIGKMNQPGPYEELIHDPLVHFVGPVESVIPYYRESSVLIVPLKTGSGTRLKILEAMSMGSPVVSTRLGAEGIQASENEHIRLADEVEDFANAVVGLLQDQEAFENQRRKARKLVEQVYDWKIIGKELNESIRCVLENKLSNAYAALAEN